jgi:hypothetical protein
MAKKKAGKPDPDEMVTRAIRMRQEYAAWLDRLASADRSTIAGVIDRALASYAKAIAFKDDPPERTP